MFCTTKGLGKKKKKDQQQWKIQTHQFRNPTIDNTTLLLPIAALPFGRPATAADTHWRWRMECAVLQPAICREMSR